MNSEAEQNSPVWARIRGKIEELEGRATDDHAQVRSGEAKQHRANHEATSEESVEMANDVDGTTSNQTFKEEEVPEDERGSYDEALRLDGEMGQGGGRQFDPDSHKREEDVEPEIRQQTFDRDPGEPNSKEDQDVEHRSAAAEGEESWAHGQNL